MIKNSEEREGQGIGHEENKKGLRDIGQDKQGKRQNREGSARERGGQSSEGHGRAGQSRERTWQRRITKGKDITMRDS